MNDKKGKYNFTPKSNALKNTYQRNNLIIEEELKKKLYLNDLAKIEQNKFNQKHNKSIDNNYLTEIRTNTNDNMINSDTNNISQILTEYLEEIQQNKNKKNELKKDDLEHELNGNKNIKNRKGQKNNNMNDKGKNENFKSSNNSSEMNYLITTNEKENIDFISTLLKLKGIRSIKTDRNGNKKENKYLYENIENNNYNLNNKAKKGLNNEAINQKKTFNNNIRNNKFIKLNQIKTGKEKSSGNLDKNIEEYSPTKNIKKLKNRNKSKLKNKSYINKTISSKNRNEIREVTINLEEPEIKNIRTNKIREKSFDYKTFRKTSPNIRDNNNRKNKYKTKSANRSPITKLLKNKDFNKSNKNNKLNITNDKEKEKSKSKITKKNVNLEKNEKDNKTRKKSEDDKKKKINTKSRKKDISKEKQEKTINPKGKNFKIHNNNNYIYKNNYRNYDPRKLKRVQNQKFSVIDEIDEETKGETMNTKKTNNKKENESNDISNNENKAPQVIKKANEIYLNNNNRYGIKNSNISLISSETFSNDMGMGFSDKKNLLASFFSTSTFNNDIVNYKPSEKNSSYALINAQNNNNNNDGDGNNINLINNLNNTNFSIINNSNININNENPNNNTLLTQTNNNVSKNNDKLVGSISDVIRLNPENEEKINFQIENNTNIINEIDSNDISDIIPLENKDITIDYKINVYDSSKLKNDLKINNNKNIGNNNNASKEISSNDEEGESIVNQFDIINNQRQNESKEIKFSQIKNKDMLSDNNNISNSNANISIVNLSKFTNFADSNIKLGDISHVSNRISGRNEMKKNISNRNMEIIQEMEQNSNNNTKKNPEKSDKKNEVNDKENDNSENCNISDDSDTIENILNDSNDNITDRDFKDNENYFCIDKNNEKTSNSNKEREIKNIINNEKTSNSNKEREIKNNINNEKTSNSNKEREIKNIINNKKTSNSNKEKETKNNIKEIQTQIKIEKEPKDSVRNNEPKDNYRKKNINYIYINKELKEKFCETKHSDKNLKNNIFEYDDINPTNRLVKTNRKDIIKIDRNNDSTTTNTNKYNNIMKISLKESLSNGLLYEKKMSCSPPPIRPNDKIEIFSFNSKKENNKNRMITEFNNIKKINKNKSILNEHKGKTLKNNNINYLVNIENRNNPQKSSIIYSNYSPPSSKTHNIMFDYPLNLNNKSKASEPEVHNFIINHTQSYKVATNIGNYGKNENVKGNTNLYVNNNNRILYNEVPLKNNINQDQNPIQYFPNNQLNPHNMNIYNNNFNDNYNINPSYNNYIQ